MPEKILCVQYYQVTRNELVDEGICTLFWTELKFHNEIQYNIGNCFKSDNVTKL